METQARNLKQIPANEVTEGDVIAFTDYLQDVTVERISSRSDGRIGLHANDDTWSAFYDGMTLIQIIDRGFAGKRIKDDLVLANVPGEIGALWEVVRSRKRARPKAARQGSRNHCCPRR